MLNDYAGRRLGFLLIVILWVILPVRAQPAGTAFSDNGQVFLPLVMNLTTPAGAGIHGRVMQSGQAAAEISLALRFYNGVSWTTLAHTTTNSEGLYTFTNAPTLEPGQFYYVLYQNDVADPDRLASWLTRLLGNYTEGTAVDLGEFDIGNVYTESPGCGAIVPLPYTFQWGVRAASPSDSYVFNLFDPTDGDPYFYSEPLGYVSGYTLDSFPPGFTPLTPYVWNLWIDSPDGGIGVSTSCAVSFIADSFQEAATYKEGQVGLYANESHRIIQACWEAAPVFSATMAVCVMPYSLNMRHLFYCGDSC